MTAAHEDLRSRRASIQQSVISLSEQLHLSAMEATERAQKALAEFDHQSEGALAKANAAVVTARTALREDLDGRGILADDRRLGLEAALKLAEAEEILTLRERGRAREPLAAAWQIAAAAACSAGLVFIQASAQDGLQALGFGKFGKLPAPPYAPAATDAGMVHSDLRAANGDRL